MKGAITPRFIRMSQAPAYLGMCRKEFNDTVRPHVREVQIGKQGIAFDRTELDRWADDFIESNAIDKEEIKADDSSRFGRRHDNGGNKTWHANTSAASRRSRTASGTSIKSSKESDFTKALELAKGKKRNAS